MIINKNSSFDLIDYKNSNEKMKGKYAQKLIYSAGVNMLNGQIVFGSEDGSLVYWNIKDEIK